MGLLAEVSVAVSHLSKDNLARWASSEDGDEMQPFTSSPMVMGLGEFVYKTPPSWLQCLDIISTDQNSKGSENEQTRTHIQLPHSQSHTHIPTSYTNPSSHKPTFSQTPYSSQTKQNAFSSHHRLRNLRNSLKSVPLPLPLNSSPLHSRPHKPTQRPRCRWRRHHGRHRARREGFRNRDARDKRPQIALHLLLRHRWRLLLPREAEWRWSREASRGGREEGGGSREEGRGRPEARGGTRGEGGGRREAERHHHGEAKPGVSDMLLR